MRRIGLIASIAFVLFIASNLSHPVLAEEQQNNSVAESHFKKAVMFSVSGALENAKSEYLKALQLDPYLAKAYNNLGYIYRQKGQVDLAIEYYNKALELNPKSDTAHTNLASVYESRNDYDRAIEEYHKALELDPGSITVELALEKVMKKKAEAEGKTFEAVQAELAVLYPEKETEPSYNKYMDLLEENEEAEESTYDYNEPTDSIYKYSETEEIIETVETTDTPSKTTKTQFESKEVNIEKYIEEGLQEKSEPAIKSSEPEQSEKPLNKVHELLSNPNVGALMVLYKK
ncbi:MAG: tetratricopeptide repeat protein [Cyanobacteriota bacterium]